MKQDHSQFALKQAYGQQAIVEQRVTRFVPMVRRAAWHIFGVGRDGLEVEDLMQAGMIALTECAQRHEGPSGDGFAAYAKLRVRGAMFDLLRKTMPDSRAIVKRRQQFEAAQEQLQQQLGRTPSPSETARQLGWSEAQLLELESQQTQLCSIDESYDDSSLAFADESADPFAALLALDDRERLIAAVSQLPERLQLVLQLFFSEELNLTEISEIMEISVPRVHQLRKQALDRLRTMMSD